VTPKELRAKKEQDLLSYMKKWRSELAVLKIQASVGQCQKPARIGDLKRDIARVKTIFKERESDGDRSGQS